MGKTKKKPRQDIYGYRREVARKQRQEKQERADKRRNYYRALSYTEAISCQCARCGAPQTVRTEKRTLNLLGTRIIAWCGSCGAWRMAEVSEGNAHPQQPVKKEIIAACKSTGLCCRFEGQYVILTGKTARWYIDHVSVHKSAFFCGKHRRVWGRNTDYSLFYEKRKVCAVDAILEIAAYDRMYGDNPAPLTKEVRDAVRKERIESACERHGFALNFKEPFACVGTDLSDWRFDYHRDRFTLLHKNDAPVLDELTADSE